MKWNLDNMIALTWILSLLLKVFFFFLFKELRVLHSQRTRSKRLFEKFVGTTCINQKNIFFAMGTRISHTRLPWVNHKRWQVGKHCARLYFQKTTTTTRQQNAGFLSNWLISARQSWYNASQHHHEPLYTFITYNSFYWHVHILVASTAHYYVWLGVCRDAINWNSQLRWLNYSLFDPHTILIHSVIIMTESLPVFLLQTELLACCSLFDQIQQGTIIKINIITI